MEKDQKLFTRDFTLVVIGQIISLFGNAVIRFALPLYLLNHTGSSALYGTVTACAFIPAILLSPVGGIAADRVNKRNVMVTLDFFTAILITAFFMLEGKVNLVLLASVTLMLLYGIAGAYQPSVQASVPVLVREEHLMEANSVINVISSFASLLGPVLGGILYSVYGLEPVLLVCIACFIFSGVMELFIRIPFARQEFGAGIFKTAGEDFRESIRFVRREKPVIGKGLLVICSVNLFLASMILVGLPYMVTEVLPFDDVLGNKLYGFAEGALAAGGLMGGVGAGLFAKKFSIQKSGNLVTACALCAFPMGIAGMVSASGMVNYIVMTLSCFFIMVFSTIFTVQMLSFVQRETPQNLMGKVIAVIYTVSMCAQPLGNGMYGVLFEVFRGCESWVILFAGAVSFGIGVGTKNIFSKIESQL